MGLFSKKKEVQRDFHEDETPKLPDLPDSLDNNIFISKNEIPDFSEKLPEVEVSELPSLPNSIPAERFNQDLIKGAINTPMTSKPVYGFDRKTIEIGSDQMSPIMQRSINSEIKAAQPIYIRLDKFEATLQNFNEIRAKIDDIERALRKVQETKQRETEELNIWERELQVIKSRIEHIDKTIFNKLD